MNNLKEFFIFCSGSDPDLLHHPDCRTEQSKYVGIGTTVFFTALFAAISAGYALHYVFENQFVSIGFGLIWGAFIFSLDRYIVSTLRKGVGWWSEFGIALPRVVLATFLAIVISKPLELKIFDKEIENELVTMQAEVRKEQDAKITSQVQASVPGLQTEIDRLKTEIEAKRKNRDLLAEEARKESDGTAGTKKIGRGPQYEVKKADADRAEQELQQTIKLNQPLIELKVKEIGNKQQLTNQTLTSQKRAELNGLLARIAALSRLAQRDPAMHFADLAILLLFILIETAPVLVKLLSPSGPYDRKLRTLENRIKAQEHARETGNTEDIAYEMKVTAARREQSFGRDLQDQMARAEHLSNSQRVVDAAVVKHWEESELNRLRLASLTGEDVEFPKFSKDFPRPKNSI